MMFVAIAKIDMTIREGTSSHICMVNQMIKRAGIYRHLAIDDPVEANDSVVTIQTWYPGEKVIRFPRKTTVLDVFNQKIIARNVEQIDAAFKLHEPRCFYYGDDAEVLLAELKK